jgi:hypothetical protein
MRKKVLDYPEQDSTPPELTTVPHHSRIMLHDGVQRFALDISRTATCLLSDTASSPIIETKFDHLRQPTALGDRIDGWRV